jgi:carboxymethylenebutenolidase
MKAALDKGNSGSAFQVYPNSGHAFHADYRPSYNEPTRRTAGAAPGWFRTHGVA